MIYMAPDGSYPRFIGDLQLEHPDWEVSKELPTGWRVVKEVDMPQSEEGKVVFEGAPAELDGVLTQVWEVRDMTPEELERKNAYATAMQKLKDAGLSDDEIYAVTSKALAF